MLAFLQYLIALLILENADAVAGAPPRPDALGIVLATAGFALAARVVGVTLARLPSARDERTLPRLLLLTTAGRIAALLMFQLVVASFGVARIPAALGIESWVLVPRLVQFVPYFALVAGLAWGMHPAAAALELGPKTGARAVADEFRQALLPLAPVLVLVTLGDLLRHLPPTSAAGRAQRIFEGLPALQAFAGLAAVFVVLLLVPFVMRLALRAKPLPGGPLRRRLEAYSQRIGFRFRDILVWPTDGDVLNAAVIGALPRFRYVLITDALLKTLSDEEVEAVFAHEAGHARRGHILLFFGFTAVLGLIGLVPGVDVVTGFLLAPLPQFLRGLVLVLVWLGVVMGWVSRRFEQEADVFGIETLPLQEADAASHPFARAMERIGNEVGAIREVTGWRHFSIASRVEFVRRYITDESVRRSYRRSILLLRGTLLVVIGGFALGAAVRVPGEIASARRQWEVNAAPESLLLQAVHDALADPVAARRAGKFFEAALFAVAAQRADDSTRWLRESVALDDRNPLVLAAYAEMLEKAGRPAGARLVWDEIAAREKSPAELREMARKRSAALGSR